MPKGTNSKGSDDDFEFKRRGGDDFNFDLDIKGTTILTQPRKTARLICTNVEIHLAENSIILTLLSIITVRNHMEDNFPRIQCIMGRYLKVHPKTGADQELKRMKLKTKLRYSQ
jgi:hypothetical protein